MTVWSTWHLTAAKFVSDRPAKNKTGILILIDELRNQLAMGNISYQLGNIIIKIMREISGFVFGSFTDVIGSQRHENKHSVNTGRQ